jgi:hypothetical protein
VRADTAYAWALAALGVPVIVTMQVGLTGASPGLQGVLVALAAVLVTAYAASSASRLPARLLDRRMAVGPVGAAGAPPGVATRTVVACLALALVHAGTRADGCLPVVGRGARVGLGWLTLQPVVPCADGTVAPTPITLAAVGVALTAVAAGLAVVAAHLSVALAAAFVTVRFAVVGVLLRFSRRVDPARLLGLLSAICPADRTAPSAPRPAPATRRPLRRPWTTQLSHRGPPMTLLPHLA